MPTAEQSAIAGEIIENFKSRIDSIEAAIAADVGGYVFGWERYGLGVKMVDGKPSTVGVERADVVERSDRRKFHNGAGEEAVLMSRKWALECALRGASASLAHLEAALANKPGE